MDIVVALALAIVGLIAIGAIFYARRNDMAHLIRSPAEAYFFVRRGSPPEPGLRTDPAAAEHAGRSAHPLHQQQQQRPPGKDSNNL
jgi:hypothetical protein